MLLPPILLHIYGPFFIRAYGFMIVLGIICGGSLLFYDKKRKALISDEQFFNLVNGSILATVAGGRIWFLLFNPHTIHHWTDIFAVWQGGLSILGAVIAMLFFVPWFAYKQNIPLFPFLDRVAIYSPLIQAISRLGCLFAGCCHGISCNLPWAITYTDPESLAPLNLALHPTQLYSSALLLILFVALYKAQNKVKFAGALFSMYIIGISFERFFVDFFRGDQELTAVSYHFFNFSVQQMTSLALATGAIALLFYIKKRQKYESI